MSGPQIRVRTRKDLAAQRRSRRHPCWDHLIAAPLWPLHGVNLARCCGPAMRSMVGSGASLNVAVAGSLVLYRLAGFL